MEFQIIEFVNSIKNKLGQKGAINLGKMVPLIGGVIGGSFDAVSTKMIGRAARDTFKEVSINKGTIIDMK